MSAVHHDSGPDEASLYLNKDAAGKLSMTLLGLGAVGLLATFGGMAMEGTQKQAIFSYLVAFFFVATLAVGGMFFSALQHLAGAIWSVSVRRISETMGSMTVPVALLALPMLATLPKVLPWLHGEEAHAPTVVAKQAFLNLPFFYVRAVIYLVCWVIVGWYFYSGSRKMDEAPNEEAATAQLLKLRKASAPAVIVFGLSLTFAGFDWLMSLSPEWYSTIFGVYIFAGTFLTTLVVITMAVIVLHRAGRLQGVVTTEHLHDLGKLQFGFTVFWTYIAFSQFFLYWYGNIPEETRWFAKRWFVMEHDHISMEHTSSWAVLSVMLVLFHFAVPFFTLLSRNAKRSKTFLVIAACMLVPMHYLDLYWVAMPVLHEEGIAVSWLDITALLGVVGVIGGLYVRQLASAPLTPIKDPFLAASMEFENA